MKSTFTGSAAITVFALLTMISILGSANAQQNVTRYTGTFQDGAIYLIEVPREWNGTLLLWSHGLTAPGSPLVTEDSANPLARNFLLNHGYALAGSSFSTTGWAVHEALPDQIAVLGKFDSLVGKPTRTIAWGQSLGGTITAGLVQNYSSRFDGAMAMCGVLAGAVGTWNEFLDEGFAFTTLVSPAAGLQLVHITDPQANLNLAQQLIGAAQATREGRARIALVAALYDTSRWSDPLAPEPAATDYETQEANQFVSVQQEHFVLTFSFRTDIEARAGGNPSWNNGVNYKRLLEKSVDYAEVKALYEKAELNLDTDLQTLEEAPRIKADPAAVRYLAKNITFSGDIDVPVLTIHTTGDELVPVENEQPYWTVVHRADDGPLLRREFVHRGGHCNFTVAEELAALQLLTSRIDFGVWPDSAPEDLNTAAAAFATRYNVLGQPGPQPVLAPSFVPYRPAPFLRPFNAEDETASRSLLK